MIEICFVQGSGTFLSEIQRLLGKAPPNFDITGRKRAFKMESIACIIYRTMVISSKIGHPSGWLE